MSLITPEFGLFFWMVVIFAAVFFILARFGFPAITKMVEKRNDYIEDSLRKADEARKYLENVAAEQKELIGKARIEQLEILKQAAKTRDEMLSAAREDASAEAAAMIEKAKKEIENEREKALESLRATVASLSVEMAEKIVAKSLEKPDTDKEFISEMISRMDRSKFN